MLTWLRHDLSLADVLLIYLLDVVGVSLVGGFGPAVLAAAAASLCLNWFFTPPLHTLTIEEPKNLLALLLVRPGGHGRLERRPRRRQAGDARSPERRGGSRRC